jgi:hypothetical protein
MGFLLRFFNNNHYCKAFRALFLQEAVNFLKPGSHVHVKHATFSFLRCPGQKKQARKPALVMVCPVLKR